MKYGIVAFFLFTSACSEDIKPVPAPADTVADVSGILLGAPCELKEDCQDGKYCFNGICLTGYPNCISGAGCLVGTACITNTSEVCDGCLNENICFNDAFCGLGKNVKLTCDPGSAMMPEEDFGNNADTASTFSSPDFGD